MIEQAQLDRLVDGELEEGQRRELLSRLDSEPDGWRRCGLAFLEAQIWREEMRSLSREPAPAAVSLAPRSAPPGQRLRTALAMAASFLLALGLGLAADDLIGRESPTTLPMRKTDRIAEAAPPGKAKETQSSAAPAVEGAAEPEGPYRYVTIPARDPVDGRSESFRVPVVPHKDLGDGWPDRLPSILPEDMVQSLRRHGHEVVQQRRLVPFRAADGSRLVFPVDEVQLVPIGRRGYQ